MIAIVSLSVSCSQRKPTSEAEEPIGEAASDDEALGQAMRAIEEAAKTSDDLRDERLLSEVDRVATSAKRLRGEGLMFAHEGDMEKARDRLDEALNAILNSGLALEAHPALQTLFQEISAQALAIDEALTLDEEATEETTLADELKDERATSESESDAQGSKEGEAASAVTYDLPVVVNANVRYYIQRFQSDRRETFAEGMQRSGRYIEMFKKIFAEEGLPTDLAYIPQIESSYKVRAYSRAKAKGIWQFMSWTAKRYGLQVNWWVDERSDPEKSCRAAARYLRDLYNELGDWLLAIAAYNGGPGRVGRGARSMKTKDFWVLAGTSRYLRRETRNFVPAILAAIVIMKQPDVYGFGEVAPDQPPTHEKVRIDSPIDLRIAAELAGLPVSTIQEHNPALRRMITPADYPNFELKLPVGHKEEFEKKLAALPPHKRLKYAEHIVRKGETLSQIARRYKTSVAAIQRANDIGNPRRLSPGQHLVVPLTPSPEQYSEDSPRLAIERPADGTKVVHTVKRGENLYLIARAYGTTVESIAEWNKIDQRKPIYPGNKLEIISGTSVSRGDTITVEDGRKIVHLVGQGDTLYGIATRYKITVAQLKRWNNLSRNLIRPGDQLTIYLGESGNDSN